MAQNKSSGLAGFLIGALLVALVGGAWYVYQGGTLPGEDQADIRIDVPGVEIEGG